MNPPYGTDCIGVIEPGVPCILLCEKTVVVEYESVVVLVGHIVCFERIGEMLVYICLH